MQRQKAQQHRAAWTPRRRARIVARAASVVHVAHVAVVVVVAVDAMAHHAKAAA
jgi:hypothetical protein